MTSVAALMLQKNPNLPQSDIESILKATALPIPSTGNRNIWNNIAAATVTWDTICDSEACDPVGAGLIQADTAVAATP